jgi:hypothetical protein
VLLVLVIALGVLLGPALLFWIGDRPLAGTDAELDKLHAQPLYDFVPPGASVFAQQDNPATNGGFGGRPGGTSTASHQFRVGPSVGAAMESFVEPAEQDGWTIVRQTCNATFDEVRLVFEKTVGSETFRFTVTASPRLQGDVVYAGIGFGGGSPGTGVANLEVTDLRCLDGP